MKKMSKAIVSLMVAATFMCCLSTTAFAAETTETQNGLELSISSDKESYSANEDINLTFKVTNTNDFDVSDVSLEALLPPGLSVKDNADTQKTVEQLGAGESVKLDVAVESIGTPTQIPDPTPTGTPNPIPTNTPNPTSNTTTVINTVATSSSTGKDAVTTGDATNVLLLIAILLLAGGGIALCAKHKVKAKGAMSLLLCATIVAGSVVAVGIPVSATDEIVKNFSAVKAITVDGKAYNVEANVQYSIKSSQNTDVDNNTVSRGEWIDMLVQEFSMSLGELSEVENPYNDIDGNQYYNSILTAYYNAILPTNITSFNADDVATRDFAVFTLNSCLCYVKNNDLQCDDFADIAHPDEASALVERGYFALIDNKFMPNKAVTVDEMGNAIALIRESLASLEIDPDHENVVDVKDDVNIFKSNVIKSINGNTVVLELTDETAVLEQGSLFFAPDPENEVEYVTYRVETISKTDTEITITVSEPEIYELFNSVDVQGRAYGDVNNIEPLVEGLNITKEQVACYPVQSNFSLDDVIQQVEELNELLDPNRHHYANTVPIDASKLRLEGTYTIPVEDGTNIVVSVNAGLEDPVVDYAVDFKSYAYQPIMPVYWPMPIKVNNLYVDLKNTLKIEANAEIIAGEGEAGELDLAKITIPVCAGVSVDVIVRLVVGVDGSINLTYTLGNTVGARYDGNGLQLIKNFEEPKLNIEAQVEASVGIQLEANLSVCSYELLYVNATVGEKGTIAIKNLSDDKVHSDFSAYMYFTVGCGTDNWLKDLLEYSNKPTSAEKEIITRENSPIKISVHLENTEAFEECTYRRATGEVKSNDFPLDEYTISVYSGDTVSADNVIIDRQSVQNDIGKFEIILNSDNMEADEEGNYPTEFTFVFEKDGYETYKETFTLEAGEDTELGVISVVKSTGSGEDAGEDTGGDEDDTDDDTDDGTSIFEIMPKNFTFASGVGGWSTEITLEKDGTFTGRYHDGEYDTDGSYYSYICNFNGKFSTPEKIDEYTYSMKLESIELERTPGEIYYEDNIKCISSEPYGFENADEFLIYLPGSPIEENLPEGIFSYIGSYRETLPSGYYGLYNKGGEDVFIGVFEDNFWGNEYSYNFEGNKSELIPSCYSKSRLIFWTKGKASIILNFDWVNDDKKQFTVYDTYGSSGYYTITLNVSEDQSTVKVNVKSGTGKDLSPWGGTTDGKLEAEYELSNNI